MISSMADIVSIVPRCRELSVFRLIQRRLRINLVFIQLGCGI